MTYSITATGHCASEEEEAKLIRDLQDFFAGREGEIHQASVSTMFHGQQDLLKKEEPAPASEEEGNEDAK